MIQALMYMEMIRRTTGPSSNMPLLALRVPEFSSTPGVRRREAFL